MICYDTNPLTTRHQAPHAPATASWPGAVRCKGANAWSLSILLILEDGNPKALAFSLCDLSFCSVEHPSPGAQSSLSLRMLPVAEVEGGLVVLLWEGLPFATQVNV